jgi:3-oxoacyl-[acyl-carrier-protein] synthase-1
MQPGNSKSRLVALVGAGARTSIGMTAASTAAAARAGVAGFGSHPFMIDTAGNKMIVAAAPYLDITVTAAERLAALAVPAAREALEPIRDKPARLQAIPVIVGLPPMRPGRPADLEKTLAERLKSDLSDEFRIGPLETIVTGHAAGMMAIAAGWKKIRQGAAEFCLVGGVDSYLEPETLEWLEANDQVHSAGPRNNAWGFIPGEAAGWCLLAAPTMAERFKLMSRAHVLTVAMTQETKLIKTDTVCIGEGLTALFRDLFAALPKPDGKVDQILCDMNGERYRAEEFGFATVRTSAVFAEGTDFATPADCWGDVGAASGPLFVVLSEAAARKGYAKGSRPLLWTSSESGERCGAILDAPSMAKGEA